MKKLLPLVLLLFFTSPVFSQFKIEAKEPPAEMEKLQFLVGKWKSAGSQSFNDKGEPMTIERGKGAPKRTKNAVFIEIEPIMGGLYLHGGKTSKVVRSFYYYNDTEKQFFHIAVDFMGATSFMSGDWNGDELVLTDVKPQTHPIEGTIMWRKTFFDISDNAHSFKYEFSRDEGKTWQIRTRQSVTRG